MPRQLKPSKKRNTAEGSETATAPDVDVEKELASAENEAGIGNGEGGTSEPEEEVEEVEEEVEEEVAPPPPEPKNSRRGRRSEASIAISAKGPASDVRRALDQVTGAHAERSAAAAAARAEREGMEEEDADLFAELLQDTRHRVVVCREFPKMWKGHRSAGRCDSYRCPTTLDEIKEDVFTRFGGKTFFVSIHPNTTTGESKTVAAMQITNPDNDVPFDGRGNLLVPEVEEVIAPVDPMLEDDPDPMARLDHALNQQVDMVTKVGKIKSARKLLKTLNEDEDEDGRRQGIVPAGPDPRVAALEKRLADMTVEQRMDRRMERLEQMILAQAENGSGKKGTDGNTQLLIAMMQSADKKFEVMMTALAGKDRKTDDLDSMLTRFAKVKDILGGENSKVKSLEGRIMEKMMDRFLDGDDAPAGESGVADVTKTAIKETMPVIKSLVEQQISKSNASQTPTQEQFKEAVKQEAQRIAQAMAKEWQDKGYLLKLPDGTAKQQALPAPKDAAAIATADVKTGTETESEEEMDEKDAPPSPQSPNYDRKRAVNFVLDSMIDEMKTQKEDGYVIGDILDRLDEELLNGFLGVSTGDDLEKLIGPYADPAKLGEIKAAGQLNPAVKNWLSRIILSAQQEYRNDMEKAKKEKEAAPAPEKK